MGKSISVYLKNITKLYGDNKALDNVNLEVKKGEVLSILGPSGCGKSTLLNVIAGLEPIEEGVVYYNNKNMTDVLSKDRGIGMVFQGYALYPNYKSKGNLSFFFWIHKSPEEEIDKRVKETSKIMGVGFDKLLGRFPKTLSGGEQQRVAIGRCIVRHPTIFLMDEPISNLDAKLRVKTRGEIKWLLMKFGITTVYVTHDQTEAISMGDRIAVMKEGKIVQMGTYDELYYHPANRFVAGFVGSPPMNFFEGKISKRSLFETGDFSLPLPLEKLSGFDGEGKSFLGIRPENVYLSSSLKGKETLIEGTVKVIEPNFEERTERIYFSTGNHNCCAKVSRDIKLNIGDKIGIAFDMKKVYLFSGKNA